MSFAITRSLWRCLSQPAAAARVVLGDHHLAVQNIWFLPVMTIKTSAPLSAEPKKKKKIDPKREQLQKDRLKRKLRKLEKVAPQLIPIEDFASVNYDDSRNRLTPKLSFEESESRALLLKEWSRYKLKQHLDEMKAVELAFEAQEEALKELRLESEELYQAALKPDPLLFPFSHDGPSYTPPIPKYEAPDGKYNNITKVYTQ